MAAPKRKPTKEAKPAGARILVVEARFYNDIADALLAGAAKVLDEAKASWDIITVPGSLEIVPAIAIAVDAAEKQKKPYDGAVALGCVIQGETFHFDIVSMQSARALIDFSVG
ncbi:MAG: 6,7-dimethyl-8-ribityllumazine synthase, partial [Alphaproteobacteria bacterium]|nr:6,7-dimethyl-8-ribityllumazine synthase [Alphaproteobacteria bacterium]